MPRSAPQKHPTVAFPDWFTDFLADRAVRKPSPHTTKAHRQDFEAIATLLTATTDAVPDLKTNELTKDTLRAAFAAYANTHSAASIRRCWSTWNTLCTFLFTAELLDANPMPLIGRPKVPKTLPKSYPATAITELVTAIDSDDGSARRSDWPERDRAILFTSLLAGLRADELLNANVGDVRRTEDGAVLHVRGKGNKDRRIPIGQELLTVLADYLQTRTSRVPPTRRRASTPGDALSNFSPTAPLFVGSDGERITRGTLQYRILRAFKRKRASTANAQLAHWFTDYATLLLSVLPVTVSGTWFQRRDTPVPYEYPVIRGMPVTFGTWSRLGPNGRSHRWTDLSCGWCSIPSW